MNCTSRKINTWQTALVNVISCPKELLELLDLNPNLLPAATAAAKLFPLKVPRAFVARMRKRDVNDPLLLQVLPIGAELEVVAGYNQDPLEESRFNPIPGLLHKYNGRVLLTLTGVCGVNCRYCFRRHFSYEENNPGTAGWQKALEYIAQDASISEVILSGGDPLVANDQTLKTLTQNLARIPHVKRLRIHSRMPVVIPERVTPELIAAITDPALKTIMVVHCNHPQEIGPEMQEAMQLLASAGITLLNQTVLLKGVNDTADILVQLSETLFAVGILPYY